MKIREQSKEAYGHRTRHNTKTTVLTRNRYARKSYFAMALYYAGVSTTGPERTLWGVVVFLSRLKVKTNYITVCYLYAEKYVPQKRKGFPGNSPKLLSTFPCFTYTRFRSIKPHAEQLSLTASSTMCDASSPLPAIYYHVYRNRQ